MQPRWIRNPCLSRLAATQRPNSCSFSPPTLTLIPTVQARRSPSPVPTQPERTNRCPVALRGVVRQDPYLPVPDTKRDQPSGIRTYAHLTHSTLWQTGGVLS